MSMVGQQSRKKAYLNKECLQLSRLWNGGNGRRNGNFYRPCPELRDSPNKFLRRRSFTIAWNATWIRVQKNGTHPSQLADDGKSEPLSSSFRAWDEDTSNEHILLRVRVVLFLSVFSFRSQNAVGLLRSAENAMLRIAINRHLLQKYIHLFLARVTCYVFVTPISCKPIYISNREDIQSAVDNKRLWGGNISREMSSKLLLFPIIRRLFGVRDMGIVAFIHSLSQSVNHVNNQVAVHQSASAI